MDGATPETCAECGFDATRWRVSDAVSLLDALGWWWRLATDGVDAAALNTRPRPPVWSTLEYGLHSAFVTAVIRAGLDEILTDDGVRLPDPPDPAGADDQPATPSTPRPSSPRSNARRRRSPRSPAAPPSRSGRTGAS